MRPRAGLRHLVVALAGAVVALASQRALAQTEEKAQGEGLTLAEEKALRALSRPPRYYFRLMGSLMVGEGIRFNNPYRLQTQLGDDAESLSLTAAYVDLGGAVMLGPPDGIQHGGALRFSMSMEGVPQQVLTPSYQILVRGGRRVMAYGRLGTPVIIEPDPNVGLEAAVGGGWFFTAGLALTAELVGDLFYGAGTREVKFTTIPVVSMQLGLTVDYEVFP
jgi:hypothetical protein